MININSRMKNGTSKGRIKYGSSCVAHPSVSTYPYAPVSCHMPYAHMITALLNIPMLMSLDYLIFSSATYAI